MIKKRRALLLNTIYVSLISLCLATAVYVRGDPLLWLCASFLLFVVCTSSYHHYKSRSFNKDTLVEYGLTLALAVAVLLGAINH